MHCLYDLQQLEMAFELKGGTCSANGKRDGPDLAAVVNNPRTMSLSDAANIDEDAW
ncbi:MULTISPECIES: hypothetical protein [Agrobacterium]|uniref:hypothetical protein n=1 Tax=Agrobacterium TaxID=357 RepID=UPI0009CD0A36|nr:MULTISPECIES: hypothetical protein [Agrobacterium]CUX70832.1 hypothetical protein AGR6A_pAt60117 [Agrobacterium sp. NCPPB 925]